jgi:hypothetical protein
MHALRICSNMTFCTIMQNSILGWGYIFIYIYNIILFIYFYVPIFSYRPVMKVENLKNPFIFLATCCPEPVVDIW